MTYDFTIGYLLDDIETRDILNKIDPSILSESIFTWHKHSKIKIFYAGTKEQFAKCCDLNIAIYASLGHMRFGNSFNALAQLIGARSRYNIKRIYFEQTNVALPLSEMFDLKKLSVTQTHSNQVFSNDNLILHLNESAIYYARCLRNFMALKPFFNIDASCYDINMIVIHIRAGDIFGKNSDNIHPSYHQPPLIWYIYCITNHIKKFGKSSIFLIYENNANPVIDALQIWCKNQHIKVYHSFSNNVKDDYRILFSAKTLIDSYGTFLYIVKEFSTNLEICYEYNDKYINNYLERGTWKNSPEQRELMLNLDVKNLNIKNFLPTIFNKKENINKTINTTEIPEFTLLWQNVITFYNNADYCNAKKALFECILHYPTEHKIYPLLNECLLHTNELVSAKIAYMKSYYSEETKPNIKTDLHTMYALTSSSIENNNYVGFNFVENTVSTQQKENRKSFNFSVYNTMVNILFQPFLKKNAFAHVNLGNLDHAETIAQNVIANNPTMAWAYYILGKVQWQRGEHELAFTNLDKAITLEPKTKYFQTFKNACLKQQKK